MKLEPYLLSLRFQNIDGVMQVTYKQDLDKNHWAAAKRRNIRLGRRQVFRKYMKKCASVKL
jgi:hypothetical protein